MAKLPVIAIGIMLIYWCYVYVAQKKTESDIINYNGPAILVTGEVKKIVHIDKKDFFDKVQTQVSLDNGITYQLYSDESPVFLIGDTVVLTIQDLSGQITNKKMIATNYKILHEGELNIKFK